MKIFTQSTANSSSSSFIKFIVISCFLLVSSLSFGQATNTWSTSTTGATWVRTTNWQTTTFVPGNGPNTNVTVWGTTTDVAQIGSMAFTGNILGINMNPAGGNGTSANSGTGTPYNLGAIVFLSTANKALTINNSAASTNGIINLNGGYNLSNVIIDNQNTTNALTLADGTSTMGIALSNASNNIIKTVAGGITISSIVSGANPLEKQGTGLLVLTGANTYTGLTTVSAGTLQLNRTGGTTIPVTNNVTISGGTLKITSNQTINNLTITSGNLVIDAGVTLTITGTYTGSGGTINNLGTLRLNGATQSFPGSGVTVNNGTANTMTSFAIGSSGAVTLTAGFTVSATLSLLSGSLNLNANTLTLNSGSSAQSIAGSGAFTISSTVAGGIVSLTGSGSHNVTLSGFGTTASGGLIIGTNTTLQMNNNAVLNCAGNGTSTSMITIAGRLLMNSTTNSNIAANTSPFYTSSGTLEYGVGYGPYQEWLAGSALSTPGTPQNVVINGSGITVTMPTTNRYALGNVTITAGTLLLNTTSGDLYVGGNLSNSGTFTHSNRAVFFIGSSQSISGSFNTNGASNSFAYVRINNGTNVTLGASAYINNDITFNSGKITLSTFDLTIANAATITTPTSSNYIVTDNTGQLKQTVAGANKFFPIGNSAYNPITLNNTGGTSDTYGLLVADGSVTNANDATLTVNRRWVVTEGTSGGSNLQVTVQYNGVEFGTNYTTAASQYLGLYNSSAWTQVIGNVTGSNPYISTSATNFTNSLPTTGTASYFAVGKDGGLTSSCTLPTTQATIGSYTNNNTGTSITVNWARGNGSNVIVVARATASTLTNPSNGTTYTSNATFGSGTQIGTGNYVVYSGTGTSAAITNLVSNTAYTFSVYEYNSVGLCYMTPASASAVTSCTTGAVSVVIAAVPSGTICSGTSVTFTATPTNGGGSPTYQWKVNGSNVGTNSTTFTSTTLANGNTVTCDITNAAMCSPTATSNTITMAVSTTPTASNAGTNQIICLGGSTTLAGNAPSAGTGAWTVSGPSTLTTQFSSTTSPTATFTPAGGAGTYTLTWTISNAPCTDSTSSVTITVSSGGATITTQPTNTISCLGSTAALSVTANNASSYAWRKRDTGWGSSGAWTLTAGNGGFFRAASTINGGGSSGIDTSGNSWGMFNTGSSSTEAKRDFSPMSVGQVFQVEMDNGYINNGGTVGFGLRNASNANMVEFYFVGGASSYAISGSGVSPSPNIPYTANGLRITVTVISSTTFSMYVQVLNGGSGYGPFTGTFLNTGSITNFRAFDVNNSGGDNFNLFFNNILVGGSSSASTLYDDNAAAYTGWTNGDNKGTSPLANGATGNGSTISGATSNSLSIATAVAQDIASYDVVVYNNCGGTVSNAVTLNLTTPPTAVAGTAITACSDSGAISIVAGASATNNSGTTWTSSGTGTFSDASSISSCTYTPSVADITAGSVTLTLTAAANAGCSNVISTKTLTIVKAPTAVAGSAIAICSNNGAVSIVAGASATNTSGTTWTTSGTGTFSAANSIATCTYTPSAADISAGGVTITLTAATNAGCATAAVSTKTITITPAVAAGTISGTLAICSNGTSLLAASGTSGGTWTSSATGVATINASSGLVTGVAAGTTTITYTVTGTGGCANSSATATVTVTTAPNAGTLSGTQTICGTATATFSSNGNSGGVWSSSDTGVATVNASSGVVTGVATGSATITYTINGTGGCATVMNTRTVSVTSTPTTTWATSATAVCSNASSQTTTLAYSATTNSPTTYSITWNASPTNSFAAVTNATFAGTSTGGTINITVPAGATANTYTGNITVRTNGCPSTSSSFTITVNSTPTTTWASAATPVCFNASSQITSLAYTATTNSPTSYSITWNSIPSNSFGVTNNASFAGTAGGGTININVPAGASANTYVGNITVKAANGCVSSGSSFNVVVNSTPVATASNNGPLCEGDTLTLTGGPDNQSIYAWSGPNAYQNIITQTETQNFDTLTNTSNSTWTDATTIASTSTVSWYSQRSGTGNSLLVDDGTGTTGGLYSYGTTSSTDRALGTTGSGNTAAGSFAHGMLIKNNTGEVVTNITVTYTLEEWRKAGGTTPQSLIVSYKTSASPITSLATIASTDPPTPQSGWTGVSGLTLASPINTTTAAKLDGNALANRVTANNISIGSISLAPNSYIMIKWEDPDHGGNDNALAIDDVSVTLSANTGQNPTVTTNVSTASAGPYNLTVTSSNGCTSTATTTVVVRPRPTASSISGGTSICLGSSANLNIAITGGTPPYDVVYSAGNLNDYTSGTAISVSPTATTTYTITSVTDDNGCVGIGNTGSAVVNLTTTTTTDGGAHWTFGEPTSTSAIVYDGGSGTIATNTSGCSLTLINNAAVLVNSNVDVTLSGPISVEALSTFTLNNNANLIQGGTTNANTGSIKVNRASSLLYRFDYTLWSSPVASQKLFAFSSLTSISPTVRFYTYNSSTDAYNSITSLSTGAASTDTFETGKGYLIRMPYNWPTFIDSSTPGTAWTGTFEGKPNNGDIPISISTSGNGFTAVGNPYPSAVSIPAFLGDNSSVESALWFWRKTNQATGSAYVTYINNTYSSGPQPVHNLEPGQGFFVKYKTSPANLPTSIIFRNTQRVGTDGVFFRNTNTTNNEDTSRVWLNLISQNTIVGSMAFGYKTGATNGLDTEFDGNYINDSQLALNSIIDNTELSVQHRAAPFDASDVVPLSFKTDVAGTFNIAINAVDGIFTGGSQPIYLKDNLTTTLHNLNTGAYTFVSDPGVFNGRFEIVYADALAVNNPVFTANNVVIYTQNNEFVVNSGNIIMSSVKVFDIRGRLIEEKKAVNNNQTTIKGGLSNEMLLVQITSEDGITVTKKVIK